jgi:ABC-type dipeptide/oligopeptide/nickel transport system ATPase component
METGRQANQDLQNWIGESPALVAVKTLVQKIASTPSTVLITGESGTGKEVVAKAIHHLSPRAAKAFMAINIGGVPENLLESELFGYERGAFTGANARKIGMKDSSGKIFITVSKSFRSRFPPPPRPARRYSAVDRAFSQKICPQIGQIRSKDRTRRNQSLTKLSVPRQCPRIGEHAGTSHDSG